MRVACVYDTPRRCFQALLLFLGADAAYSLSTQNVWVDIEKLRTHRDMSGVCWFYPSVGQRFVGVYGMRQL